MAKARVRGIYSTALTKLLRDHDFTIVQPSPTMKERFRLEELDETPNLEVYDRPDLQGVQARGKAEFASTFKSILQSSLVDVVVREWRSSALHPLAGTSIGKRINLVKEGESTIDVEFPTLSKKKLDELRSAVARTLDGHHYYKACGEGVSSALDMAEKMFEKGCSRVDVEHLFKQTIEANYPRVGSLIDIEHAKLDGQVFNLGKASIDAFNYNKSLIQLSRVFRNTGVYDGLKTRKAPDDYAVTEVKLGEWHYKTKYFSKGGRYKGAYINLNTPIELYPYGIRYVDLEVDVCVWPNGRVRVLDEKKLEDAATEGLITQKLIKNVRRKLRELVKENLFN
ncbi:MAG: DUF402 domain-containing protein [Candidatus Bathyarchaeota archaeon]|nr:MAG: DUF402 domain-containing protein [Candidatus Bathyarchaeota archaeon]